MTLKPGIGFTEGHIENGTIGMIRSPIYEFLLILFNSNYGPILYRFRAIIPSVFKALGAGPHKFCTDFHVTENYSDRAI